MQISFLSGDLLKNFNYQTDGRRFGQGHRPHTQGPAVSYPEAKGEEATS